MSKKHLPTEKSKLHKEHYDVVIVGAGAAGLAAAARLAALQEQYNSPWSVLLVDRCTQPGKKLYATGNGRCNVSNTNCATWPRIQAFLETLGLPLMTEEEGRVYPYSERAEDVVEALTHEAERGGFSWSFSTAVAGIQKGSQDLGKKADKAQGPSQADSFSKDRGEDGSHNEDDNKYYVTLEGGQKITCSHLLLAMGGKAAPVFGTLGEGFSLARELGHKVHVPYPALAPIYGAFSAAVPNPTGLRMKAQLTLVYKDAHTGEEETLFVENGVVQLAKEGISGIVVFNASRFVTLGQGRSFQDYRVYLDLVPAFTDAYLEAMLDHHEAQGLAYWTGFVPSACGPLLDTLAKGKTSKEKVALLHRVPFQVQGVGGWKTAQCTGGGVAYQEVNPQTMESLLYPRLFFAGELLDYCGPCGGYNLNHAFTTGILAAEEIARQLTARL